MPTKTTTHDHIMPDGSTKQITIVMTSNHDTPQCLTVDPRKYSALYVQPRVPKDAKTAILIYWTELRRYFYHHQYDDRYQHFRDCDEEYEYDDEGNKMLYYCFYD